MSNLEGKRKKKKRKERGIDLYNISYPYFHILLAIYNLTIILKKTKGIRESNGECMKEINYEHILLMA